MRNVCPKPQNSANRKIEKNSRKGRKKIAVNCGKKRQVPQICGFLPQFTAIFEVWRFFFRHFRKSSNLCGFLPQFTALWRGLAIFFRNFRKSSRFGDFYRNLPQRQNSCRKGPKSAANSAKPVLNRFKPVFSPFFICESLRKFAAAKPAIIRKIIEFCDFYRNLPHFGEVWRFFFRNFRKSSRFGGFYRNLPQFVVG